ncbi:MAG: hypothetical protein E5V22_05620 [Mesorhizobium sp.]|nr:MAG: hypothetical protein E5V22_05620 [Mesorhizobium sp.]
MAPGGHVPSVDDPLERLNFGSQRLSQRLSSHSEICLESPDLGKVADAATYQRADQAGEKWDQDRPVEVDQAYYLQAVETPSSYHVDALTRSSARAIVK